jgi:hypothetical protein
VLASGGLSLLLAAEISALEPGTRRLSAARFHPVLQLTERKECYASGLPLQEPTSLFALQRNFWTGLVVRIASGIGSPHIIPFARSVADGF